MVGCAESRMKLDGCEISLRRGGSGPPLVFLHGASGAGPWSPFHDALAAKFDVIAPSHPGFDDSDDPPWLDNIADLANFYNDFMRTLELTNVHLVGLSLGGWVAAEMAVRDTSRIATCTLKAAAGIHVEGIPQFNMFLVSPEERVRRMFHDPAKAEPVAARVADPANADAVMKN